MPAPILGNDSIVDLKTTSPEKKSLKRQNDIILGLFTSIIREYLLLVDKLIDVHNQICRNKTASYECWTEQLNSIDSSTILETIIKIISPIEDRLNIVIQNLMELDGLREKYIQLDNKYNLIASTLKTEYAQIIKTNKHVIKIKKHIVKLCHHVCAIKIRYLSCNDVLKMIELKIYQYIYEKIFSKQEQASISCIIAVKFCQQEAPQFAEFTIKHCLPLYYLNMENTFEFISTILQGLQLNNMFSNNLENILQSQRLIMDLSQHLNLEDVRGINDQKTLYLQHNNQKLIREICFYLEKQAEENVTVQLDELFPALNNLISLCEKYFIQHQGCGSRKIIVTEESKKLLLQVEGSYSGLCCCLAYHFKLNNSLRIKYLKKIINKFYDEKCMLALLYAEQASIHGVEKAIKYYNEILATKDDTNDTALYAFKLISYINLGDIYLHRTCGDLSPNHDKAKQCYCDSFVLINTIIDNYHGQKKVIPVELHSELFKCLYRVFKWYVYITYLDPIFSSKTFESVVKVEKSISFEDIKHSILKLSQYVIPSELENFISLCEFWDCMAKEEYNKAYCLLQNDLSKVLPETLQLQFLLGRILIVKDTTVSLSDNQGVILLKTAALGTLTHKSLEACDLLIDLCGKNLQLPKWRQLLQEIQSDIEGLINGHSIIINIGSNVTITRFDLNVLQNKINNLLKPKIISEHSRSASATTISLPREETKSSSKLTTIKTPKKELKTSTPTSVVQIHSPPQKKLKKSKAFPAVTTAKKIPTRHISAQDLISINLSTSNCSFTIKISSLLKIFNNGNQIVFDADSLCDFCYILGKLFKEPGPNRAELFIPEITYGLQQLLSFVGENKLTFNALQITKLISGLNNLYLSSSTTNILNIMSCLYEDVCKNIETFSDWQLLEILRSITIAGIHQSYISSIKVIINKLIVNTECNLPKLCLEQKTMILYYLSVIHASDVLEVTENSLQLIDKLIYDIWQEREKLIRYEYLVPALRRYNIATIFWKPEYLHDWMNENDFWEHAKMACKQYDDKLPKFISRTQSKVHDLISLVLTKTGKKDIVIVQEQLVGNLLKPIDIGFNKNNVPVGAIEVDGNQHFLFNINNDICIAEELTLRDKFLHKICSNAFIIVSRIQATVFDVVEQKTDYIYKIIKPIIDNVDHANKAKHPSILFLNNISRGSVKLQQLKQEDTHAYHRLRSFFVL